MIEYVAGFMFSMDGLQVALVRKNRPAWQAGHLNAIGGHIEEGETPHQAMVREFREETGVSTYESDWRLVVRLTGPDYRVHFFSTFVGIDQIEEKPNDSGEYIAVYYTTGEVYESKHIANLAWLIPLCLDSDIATPIEILDRKAEGAGRTDARRSE